MLLGKNLLVFAFLLFLIFISFSYYVGRENLSQLDLAATVKLQAIIPHFLDLPFSLLSILGSAEVTFLLWLGLLFFFLKKHFLTFLSLFLFIISSGLEAIGKLFVFHPGPPSVFYRGVLALNLPSHFVQTDYSFPSGHMTRTSFLIFFGLFFAILYYRQRKRLIASLLLISLLLLMIVSRIYLGEHWLTDVVGGLFLGGSFGTLSASTLPKTNNPQAKS